MTVGEVRQQLAEEGAELEAVPTGAAADDDVARSVQHEVGIDRVVVDAAFGGDGHRVEAGQQAAYRVGQHLEKYGIVGAGCRGGDSAAGSYPSNGGPGV